MKKKNHSKGKKKRHNNKQRKGNELNTLMHINSENPIVDQMDGLDPVANAGRSVLKQQLIINKKKRCGFSGAHRFTCGFSELISILYRTRSLSIYLRLF